MNSKLKDKKKVFIAGAVVLIIALLSTLIVKQVDNRQANLDSEILRSMNYTQITDEDSKVENTDYVRFSAFFTRDLDGDGNAEKLLGTCRRVNEKDQLYIDLNVLTNGYLKDGVITINGKNFKYSMNMIKDSALKNNYISNDVRRIELNQINAGTQKLIIGNILSYIGNDTNNYSVDGEINSITLTGTHVSDEGVETPINKTVYLTVDWHGEAKASIYAYNVYYNYDNLDTEKVSFSFSLDETQNELILKDSEAKVTIPSLNGFEPTEVKCTNSNIESEYNSETKELIIKRSSVCNEQGIITSTLSRSNSYTVEIAYPKEAYDAIDSYTTLKIPIEGYYTGYNNKNEEFTNPYTSNIAKTNISLIFRETPKGEIYNFYVDFVDKKYSRGNYVISKQDILNLYDNYNEDDLSNEEDSEENNNKINKKQYVVRWRAVRGSAGEVPSMIMSETKESSTENAPYGDKWSNTIMQEYVTNTGIYFENADQILEEDGTISVYNDDTNELIHTFTKEEWNKYTRQNPYKYENSVRHVRVETSKAKLNSSLSVYHIKELETEKVLNDFTKEQVKDVEIIYTYLTGICNIEGQDQGIANRIDSVRFVSEKSEATISLGTPKMSTQETLNNQKIYINTICNNEGDAKWKNGEFLVEIPKEIINMDIKNVSTNNNNVKIVAYDLYNKDDKYFIKIITENEEPEKYRITIDCTMTSDPRAATSDKNLRLYSYNEYCNEYYNEIQDKYDVDSDNNTSENVGTSTTNIQLMAPTSLITLETITDYDNTQEDEVTVAPNIAEVTKDAREATINVSVTNNYPNTVSGVQILGKIPFKGNSYILNEGDMGSEFTTTMKEQGIVIPKDLEGHATVYYSENENPNIKLEDSKNGWTLKENVQDFNKIKTYLIDLSQSTIEVGKSYEFNYTVSIPENTNYNFVSYSDHAVYYELDTEGGKLQQNTEPNKVGLRVIRKYGLELTKNKKDFENLKVAGATYKVEYTDLEGNERSRLLTTNSDGYASMEDLYVGITYKVKEIKSPENYELNDKVMEFKVVEDNQGNLQIETEQENITINQQNEMASIKTEDEPKYKLTITKQDKKDKSVLSNIIFRLNGKTYSTDRNGEITIERLSLNKEYTLSEIKAEDYYLLDDITFKVVKDSDGNLKVESDNSELADAQIVNSQDEDLIKVNAVLTNEKIPTYDLQVLKVEENEKEDDIEKLTPLKGAKFELMYNDLNKEETYTTDENGNITIPNLYQYVEGKNVTGSYVLREIEAPQGYSNCAEEIYFKAEQNAEGKLELKIENISDLVTVKDVKIDGETIRIVIQDKPLFKLTKTDSETGAFLANAKFVIYEVDSNRAVIDYAKDVNGNYVGEIDDEERYVITTDESGTITLPLKAGEYKLIEIEAPDGYYEYGEEQYFKVAGEVPTESSGNGETGGDTEDDNNTFKIETIEDLVELSNRTNTYPGGYHGTVKLMRSLDFNESNSYRDANAMCSTDLNGNGVIETIKEELTNKNGCGFTPIGIDGTKGYYFGGKFDGQDHEIRNLYIYIGDSISGDKYAGLFGYIGGSAVIKNVGVTGSVKVVESNNKEVFAGGIVGYGVYTSTIENSFNKCDVSCMLPGSSSVKAGGIAGGMDYGYIRECYNSGKINISNDGSLTYVGGIIGCMNYGQIIDCYNTKQVTGITDSASAFWVGGIAGVISSNDSVIRNCYNTGDVRGDSNFVGGVVGRFNGYELNDCYNTGDVINKGEGTYNACTGGIIGNTDCNYDFRSIINCYNTGNIYGQSGYTGGIIGDIPYYSKDKNKTMIIKNCYNTGAVNSNLWTGGIVGCTSGSGGNLGITIVSCFNTGVISGSRSGGIIGVAQATINSVNNCYNIGTIVSSSECAGGIAGVFGNYGSNISNCYNTGNVSSMSDSGGIVGRFYDKEGTINNCYYLSTAKIEGSTICEEGIPKDSNYMKSQAMFDLLNVDNVWIFKGSTYPKLTGMPAIVNEVTQIDIKNTMKRFNITTEIGLNSEQERAGGTITGEYSDEYLETCNVKFVENVVIYKDNTKKIDIVPIEGYAIKQILINGNSLDFVPNNDGNYEIPAGYFECVTEDKHIIVVFERKSKTLTINKVDSDDNSKKLEGAKFKIEQIDDRAQVSDEVKAMVKNGSSYREQVNEVLGNLTSNGSYYFYYSNGTYIPNNKSKSSKTANSYIPIDLTGKSGNYTVIVNAQVSSESGCDYGYATITQTTTAPSYSSSTGQFMKISGTVSATNYSYTTLQGGNKYYLHLGYSKDGSVNKGSDMVTINSIKVYSNSDTYKSCDFTEDEETYISNNQYQDGTVASSYIPIDLSNTTGKYNLTVNAEISSESGYDYGYAIISTSTSSPSYDSTEGRLIYISGTQNAQDYTTVLSAGTKYYLHLGYYKNNLISRGTDTFKINSVKLSLNTDDFYRKICTTNSYGQIIEGVPYARYKITEVQAPAGYVLDKTLREVTLSENGANITIENEKDKPVEITKIDKETSKTIPNTKFVMYRIATNNSVIDFAKDYNGNYLGTKEGDNYVLTTDENGQIKVKPQPGLYKIVEIESADGYIFEEDESLRTTYIKVEDYISKNDMADKVITNIEDFVRLSNEVNSGISYEGKTIILSRTLDFDEDSSYNDPNDTSFGDYNGDGTKEGIKAELAKSSGFKTIGGSQDKPFKGVFDGNGYKIKNICQNYSSNNIGLFGYVESGKILNLGLVDGNVNISGRQTGSIAYSITNSTIDNCYNTATVYSGPNSAGIVYTAENSTISNCYNEGDIGVGGGNAGIAFNVTNSTIVNCYNKGFVHASGGSAGIAYTAENSAIINCCNVGNVSASTAVGIVSTLTNSTISNCYNTGNINGGTKAGIIVSQSGNNKISNCYYLDSSDTQGIYNQNDIYGVVEPKTEEEMKSEQLTNLLNNNRQKIESKIKLNEWIHIPDNYPLVIEMDNSEIETRKEITITNEKAGKVIIHHYLEGTGPEYETDPITFEEAPDEILVGKLDEEYISTPHMDIPKHTLVTDENGEYIIPEGANGNYAEEVQHVYYYYNKNKVNLTVHHYLEGTENKVPLGKNEQDEDRFAEDEHSEHNEGYHYKTNASEEVLQKYELVAVVGDEEKDIMHDEVVIYYYRIKSHEITTRVEVPEGRSEEEKGGQISGEGEKPYETVDHEKASINDIVVTPDAGYRAKQIRLISTNEEGNTQESIIYIDGNELEKEEAENAEITYTQSADGTITLTKFENMTEDKEVIVVFEKDEGRLIVHHYIEGTTEKIYDDQITIKPVGTELETSPVKVGKYVLVVEEPEDRKAIITKETQEKTYYYQEQYKITTEVIKHSESYKDGKVETDIKGGQIESESKDAHELVLKNRPNTKTIEITPDSGYEIVNITIKDGKDAKEGMNLDFDQYKEKDENGKETGRVILPAGLFTSMKSDKHIQVELRKKTNVIVKHLEAGTENVLYKTEQGKDYEELKGYEGQDFETNRKVIPNYMAAEVEIIENTSEGEEHVTKVGITNENKEHMTKYTKIQTDEETYVNGEMYADTLTIIYWYTRVPSGIIVRHIETNEKAEEKEIESKLVDGLAGLDQPTTRNKYSKYIPVDRKEENKDDTNENITIMTKNQNSKTLTFAEDEVLEVWYFYEKQYNVTTEVKLHKEIIVNPETGKTETKQVAGGTISKKYEKDEQGNYKLDDKGNKIETVYEEILSRGDSKEEIEIKPDSGYRIKAVTKQKKIIVNGKETYENEKVFIENMIKEDGSLVLGQNNESYLTDVQNDYNIVVEFERIPAKVIVEYKDAYTKETIHEDKIVDGFVNDKYNESRIDIESYITAEVDAVKDGNEVKASVTYNGEGNENTAYIETEEHYMTEDVVTITYWYTKQFKITTDVKEHEEDDGEGNKVSSKGGELSGEDETPYEIITRGEDSTKEITMKPEEGYRIKEVTINGIKIEIKDLLKEDGSITMPLFENMQEDKHIVVEFERIPAKVIVEHLDEEINEPIVDKETLDGYVNKDYETEPKDLKYYELVKEKYPENDKGIMTREDITVKYYYRKLKFNMKIEKEIQNIKLNGQETGIDLQSNKYAKLEVEYKEIENTNIEVSYKIKVTNTEKVAGIAIVEEMIPEGLEFVKEESDENWLSRREFEGVDNIYILKTKELQPGETVEYVVTLRWKAENSNKGERVNTAKIANTENEPNYEETTLGDNEDKAIVEIRVNKTLQDVIDNIKDGKVDEAIKDAVDDVKNVAKDVITSVKTGDPITISVIVILIAGMAMTMTITAKRKSINVKNKSVKINSKAVKKGKHER